MLKTITKNYRDRSTARAEPIANVIVMIKFTLMPISCAAPLSSDTAIIARPTRVYFTNRVKAAITTMDAAKLIRV